MPTIKVTITGGKVHNVGYRLFLLEGAEGLFIPYFDARNVGKDSVVALAEGDEEQIKEFTEFCKSSFPPGAEVGDVSVEGYTGRIRSIDSFHKTYYVSLLSRIARTWAKMTGV